jgi:hypothetical protein
MMTIDGEPSRALTSLTAVTDAVLRAHVRPDADRIAAGVGDRGDGVVDVLLGSRDDRDRHPAEINSR